MDIQTLKLHLINRIMEVNNPEVLTTVRRILDMEAPSSVQSHLSPFASEEGTTNAATQDLQNDIDEIFNP